jgi:hypothetical protein
MTNNFIVPVMKPKIFFGVIIKQIKIGKVVRESYDKYRAPKRSDPREKSILKTLQLVGFREIRPSEAWSLKIARPPLTTKEKGSYP